MISPPSTLAELLVRARALAGQTIGELGHDLGCQVPVDQRRAKGLVGQMLERALGASAGSRAAPDFPGLGVELPRGTPGGAPTDADSTGGGWPGSARAGRVVVPSEALRGTAGGARGLAAAHASDGA